jgi:molybdenum cofactor biosynthesis protein B
MMATVFTEGVGEVGDPGARAPQEATRRASAAAAATRAAGMRQAGFTATKYHGLVALSPADAHRADAPAAIRCFVVTISDTRTEATDTSGAAIASLLESAGHIVSGRKLVKDDATAIRGVVSYAAKSGASDVVITTGGTGISARDGTYEAIASLFDRRLDGFGELFRALSFPEIGSAAMLTRATAGTIGRCAVFVMPGSENAVRLGMEKLILPEVGHVVRELRR